MYKNIAVHILLISIIIGFSLSSCNNQKKEYMVEGYYNYSSSNEIGEIRNSIEDTHLTGIVIENFEIDSIQVYASFEFYKDKLMSIFFEVKPKYYEIFLTKYKNQKLDENIGFKCERGECYETTGFISKGTFGKPYCFMWYDKRLSKQYENQAYFKNK